MIEPNSNKKIRINQTLHGYLDGHRLLASSKELSKEVKRQILILSDLSGPMVITGYKKYITGYPIYEEKSFAIAKTWYADEMQRAGCAWTHTLLIRFDDLKVIPDLSLLLKYFVRPTATSDTGLFEQTIVLDEYSNAVKSNSYQKNNAFYHKTKCILNSLYDRKSSDPVIVAADDSSEYEDIVLKIWSQQWPNLRNTFKFCTGAIANRKYNGEIFDLQIVPTKYVHQVGREIIDAKIIDKEDKEVLPNKSNEWLDLTVKDLLGSESFTFRKYLQHVGMDLPGNRCLYADIADIYSYIPIGPNEDINLENLFKRIYQSFPEPSEGKYLKNTIVGEPPEGMSLIKNLSDVYIFKALSFTKYSKMFNLKQLNIQSRTVRAWKNNNQNIKNLLLSLIRTEVNTIGEKILKGVAEIINKDQLLDLTVDHPELLYAFIMHNPSLAIYPELWLSSHINQLELIEYLSNVSMIRDDEKNKITNSVLSSGNDNLIDSLYQLWGVSILEQILNWIDNSDSISTDSIKPGLLNVIRESPGMSLEWLSHQKKFNLETAVIIASQLNPHGKIEQEYGTKIWLNTIELFENSTPERVRERFAKFLLPFGLNNPGDRAYELVIFSFPIIHRALAKSKLDYDSWKILDSMLPKLSWYRSWDKCERLRRGVVDSFKKFNWPSEELLKVNNNENLLY